MKHNEEWDELYFYDVAEICVACGKPSLPNDMLCAACRKLANRPCIVRREPVQSTVPDTQEPPDQRVRFPWRSA